MNLNTGNKQEKKNHNESKSLVFEISMKLTVLARVARVTFLNKGEKIHITIIRNERCNIITDLTDIKRINSKHHE